MGKTKYNKSFPSDPDLLPEIEDWIMEIAQEANLNEDKFNHLALSVAEASSNSIMHGNKADKNIPLNIEVATRWAANGFFTSTNSLSLFKSSIDSGVYEILIDLVVQAHVPYPSFQANH